MCRPLGNGNFHFSGYVGRCRILGPYQTKRGSFHSTPGIKYFLAFRRQPNAIDVASDELRIELLFKVGNSSTQRADRHRQVICGGANAATPNHLDEQANALPIRRTTCRPHSAMSLWRLTPGRQRAHTTSPSSGKLPKVVGRLQP